MNFNNLKKNKHFSFWRPFILSTVLLVSTTVSALNTFDNGESNKTKTDNRIEFNYKQRHSDRIISKQNIYADGIKIKRDLSLLKEIQEQRILAADEIPAEELYGGIWVNNRVAAYNEILKKAPDTLEVDLSNFTVPTTGHVTSLFGMRGKRRMHYGMDLKVQVGDTIYAAFDGKVRVRQYEKRGYGYYLVIRHPNGLETVYGHLSGFLVNVDDVVRSGQPIALGGNTGRSSGSHLHFEFRYLGKNIDPREIVDFENKVCHKDKYTITPNTFNYRGSKWATYIAKSPSASNTNNKFTAGNVNYHRIKRGDTLGAIARRYGTTVNRICQLNSITAKTILREGKSLRIS